MHDDISYICTVVANSACRQYSRAATEEAHSTTHLEVSTHHHNRPLLSQRYTRYKRETQIYAPTTVHAIVHTMSNIVRFTCLLIEHKRDYTCMNGSSKLDRSLVIIATTDDLQRKSTAQCMCTYPLTNQKHRYHPQQRQPRKYRSKTSINVFKQCCQNDMFCMS